MMAIKDNCIRTFMTWSVLYVILIISYSALLKPMDDTQKPASSHICHTLRVNGQTELSSVTLHLTVTALKRPSSVQRRHYGAVGAREFLRPYLL